MSERRISRPCWDKPHRCPGWAGGGWKSAAVDRCADGRVEVDSDWRFGRCVGNRHTGSEPCGVITIPWALRYLDPRWWRYGWRFVPDDVRTWFAIKRWERRNNAASTESQEG